jgi:heavy metal efflux system protein
MNNFYEKYKSPILVILLMILFGGAYSLVKLKTGLFPDVTFPKIKIIADNGEQPVDKMMITVTAPLENAIKKVEGLESLRSTTSRGSCEISAFLNWGSDVDLGKQRIEAQINAIKQNLPPGIDISIEKMNPSILPVMGFSLEGKNKTPIELRQLAEFTIKPFLSRIAGVSEIAVIGGKIKEYQIILDPIKLSNLRISPQDIAGILAQYNFIASNGYENSYNRLYLSLTDASINQKSELENTIIVNSAKSKIALKDIAEIKVAEQLDYVRINANGKDVPLIAIMKQPGANLIDVTQGIKDQLKELNKILPNGVELKPYYDQAEFVSGSINSLKDVLWIGLLLAIIVTILFLRSFKASSIILITIPVTLGLTLIILFLLGYTFNIMTIGAIAAAIGLIIDDAIVVVEQIHRTHEEFPEEKSSNLVGKSIKYLFPAMLGSSLSTIVIFFPFVFMGGVAGAYFTIMTNAMIITLLSSFIVTWVGLPVLYLFFSKKAPLVKTASKEVKKREWVLFFINRPYIAGVFILILIALSIFILPKLSSGFLPEMDEGSIVLDFNSPPGTSLDATDKMLRVVDGILLKTPEVESFSRRTGTQMGFFITEPNRGDYLIKVKNKRDKTTTEVSDEIRKKIEAVLPSLTIDFGQVITDMLGDLMESAKPVEVKIYGDDYQKLREIADSVASSISNVKGTTDVFNGVVIAGPEIYIKPKIDELLKYNMTPTDFQFQMQSKLEGNIVGSVLDNNQSVKIRMMEQNHDKPNPDLSKASIFLKDGKIKPLNEFANIEIKKGVAETERENLKSMIAVTARLDNRDLGSVLSDVKKEVSKNVSLPGSYQIIYGGAYAQQQKAFDELLLILFSAVLLVFTVILFLFRNIKISIAIILIAILGISGSIIALYLTGTPLNVGSYTGLIMIIGIIGENSIFTYLQFSEERKKLDVKDAAVMAVSRRLRPNLMTAIGAMVALFPLALGLGAGAQMHQPLAIAITGGFIITLPLLLIVLPTILPWIEKDK